MDILRSEHAYADIAFFYSLTTIGNMVEPVFLQDAQGNQRAVNYRGIIYTDYAWLDENTVYNTKLSCKMSIYVTGGYAKVNLRLDGIQKCLVLHVLKMWSFIGPPPDLIDKYTVDHIDRCKLNNELSNLRWATKSEQSLNQVRKPVRYAMQKRIQAIDKNGRVRDFLGIQDLAKALVPRNDKRKYESQVMAARRSLKHGHLFMKMYIIQYAPPPNLVWRELVQYPGYKVSECGSVIDNTGRWTQGKKQNGYRSVSILGSSVFVHVLVAKAFIVNTNPSEHLVVNHKDGVRHNNRRVSNLEWTSQRSNARHAAETGLIKTCMRVIATNIKTGEKREFFSQSEAARQLGTTKGNICACLRGMRNIAKGHTISIGE